MEKSIYTVCDMHRKIAYKSFESKDIYGPDNPAGQKAHEYQKTLCDVFGLKNDGSRIGVHVNIFNDIPKKKVLY